MAGIPHCRGSVFFSVEKGCEKRTVSVKNKLSELNNWVLKR